MAEYTETFTYDSEKLSTPLNILETDLEVTVITFSETLDAGTYKIDMSMVGAFTSAGDCWDARVAGAIVSPAFSQEASNPDDVLPVSYMDDLVHAGGVMTINLFAQIDGGGVANITIQTAIIAVRRVA